ncbi:hypothetical protein [Actinoplanes teichomyceticus]|uniref:Uncharacterized protein n=1 Tax=Actinoplanes teichomyceticus TaxID=1867 RepID=A0A561VGB0_ACTTI|nr:hypothetical protein [Actinoplanes teichomyceticus]TWG10660.1 hypothetical protein FHX34_107152 [Actinoplanes teichomyceticus]
MTPTARRTPVPRSLPALLALLLTLFAAPVGAAGHPVDVSSAVAQHIGASVAAATGARAASAQPAAPFVLAASAEVIAPPAEPVAGRPVTDRTRVRPAQRSARVAGSRAPPRTAA